MGLELQATLTPEDLNFLYEYQHPILFEFGFPIEPLVINKIKS